MTKRIYWLIGVILSGLAVTLVAGCSGGSGTGNSAGTGGITAQIAWAEAAKSSSAVKAAAPAGVATIRGIISASGMTSIQQDYPASAASGSISGVPAGTGRTLTVQGLNSAGAVTHQGQAANLNVLDGQITDAGIITLLPVGAIPAAPSALTATAVSSSQINLSWIDNATNATGFKIERKTGANGTYAQVATAGANVVSYSDTGLAASTAYYYRVRATNSSGDSGYSNEANATTQAGGGTGGSIQLPKTGQTVSYAAGDDGALKKGVAWPSPRFTDNNNGTVTDNLTGLVWLKNANCFGQKNWNDALTASNSLASGACGLTDGSTAGQWRLPNRNELQSLIDRSKFNPALPAGHPFNGVKSKDYWSSSTHAGDSTYAWFVDVYLGGGVGYSGKSNDEYVWPVRADTTKLPKTGQITSYAAGDDGALKKGVAWPSPRFSDNSNGSVTDNLTGLIWLKNANCFGQKNWNDALTASNSLASGACGLSDGSTAGQWRLPNVTELESLVDIAAYNPALPSGHPFSNVQGMYWSSSSYTVDSTVSFEVSMDDGYVPGSFKSYNVYHVWPVRGGQ